MHYPETRLALMRIWRSGGGFDLDIISEVLDAAHEAHGCAGLVITSKVVRSEVAKEGTVAQHMVDGGEDRCGDRDGAPAAAWPQTNVNVAPDNTSGPQLPVPSVQDFGISLQGQMLPGAELGLRSSLDVPSDYGGFRHEQLRSHRRWADNNGRRQHAAIRRADSTASASATKPIWNRQGN